MWDLWEIQARISLIYGLKSPGTYFWESPLSLDHKGCGTYFGSPLIRGSKSPGTYFGPRLMQYEKMKNKNKGQRFLLYPLLFYITY